MFLLDTNVVSEIRKIKSQRANPQVVTWVSRVNTDLTFISIITLQELEMGVLLAQRRDPVAGATLRSWLDNDVVDAFALRILSIDARVARIAAALHIPDPAPTTDALIAATAMAHNMVMVTRNTKDFQRFHQLDILNPWEPTGRENRPRAHPL